MRFDTNAQDTQVGSNDAVVRALRFVGNDRALLAGLKDSHPGAAAELYDRYADHVQRVLARILGLDQDLADVLQEVFLEALRSIRSVEDGSRLKAWLTSVAVHTAHACLRRRGRRKWLLIREPELVPEQAVAGPDHEARQMLQGAYEVLDRMPVKERIAFALRHVEDLPLAEVAEACGVSLATVKRVLARAEKRFTALAGRHPLLRARLAELSGRRNP
ncbi:MAG: sigma-70 family RNA polymerase sigma factor [Deltaproteobacteria bacterium]|nr:sigma-70 family RNA polymerase sigma factor [Deltaproteobacteria bacterium]